MRQRAVSFEAGGLIFEGVVAVPDKVDPPVPGVVICHPHPLRGGSMDNNVVLAVSFALADAGVASIRFNFRGVGNSQGRHTEGELEHEEAMAAIKFLRDWEGIDGSNIGLAGYSFGTGVIMGSIDLQEQGSAFALISPSYERLKLTHLKTSPRPTFIISGDRDRLIDAPELPAVLQAFAGHVSYEFVAGADHFWHGQEEMMSRQVVDFFTRQFHVSPARSI